MNRMRIALLVGGWSGEREVSLASGEAVYQALDREKYEVLTFDPKNELQALIDARRRIDLAFILLHGRFGEDGRIQGMLNVFGIPFVGSGVLASAMAFDKKVAKGIYRAIGLGVAKDVVLGRGQDFSTEGIMEILGPITIVKPAAEGSSLGMSVCQSRQELEAGIEKAFEVGRDVIIEEYIQGKEITGCVLGDNVLPLVEIVPKASAMYFDFDSKYIPGAAREICPASLPDAVADKARYCAKRAHVALQCSVWSRTDMIIREDGHIFLLETNTVPGMTKNSLFPLAARAANMPLSDLLDELINLSLVKGE